MRSDSVSGHHFHRRVAREVVKLVANPSSVLISQPCVAFEQAFISCLQQRPWRGWTFAAVFSGYGYRSQLSGRQ